LWFSPAEAVCTPLGTVTSNLGLCKPQAGEVGWSSAINSNWDTVDANVGTIPSGAIMFYGGNSPPNGWYVCDGSAKNRTTDANLFTIFGTTYGAGDGSTTFNLPNGGSRTPMFSGTGNFVSSTDFTNVNAATDTITVPTNNSLYTGTLITFATTGTAPGGLTNGNPYYVVNVSSTQIQLATTQANAVAGTQINITTQGTGTHSFTVTYSTRNLADLGGEETHASTIAELASHTHGINSSATALGGSNQGSNTGSASTAATGGSTGHNILSPFITFTCIVKR
jgi:microcystin-dependent protein